MMRRNTAVLSAILMAIAMVGLAPPGARADFEVIITDGHGDSIVATQSGYTVYQPNGQYVNVTGYSNSPNGLISVQASMFNLAVTMTTVTGSPLLGSSALDISNITVDTTGAAKLTVTAYQTGDTFSTPNPTAYFDTSIGGTLAGASISSQTYYDTSNTGNAGTAPTFTAPSGSMQGFATTYQSMSGSFGASTINEIAPPTSAFALIDTATLSFAGAGVASYDLDTAIVMPAPAGLSLALSALPALGLWSLRRRTKINLA